MGYMVCSKIVIFDVSRHPTKKTTTPSESAQNFALGVFFKILTFRFSPKTTSKHPKIIPQSSKNHSKIIPNTSPTHIKNIPKSSPNHLKIIRKSSQNHF